MERRFRKSIDVLDEIFTFTEKFFEAHAVEPPHRHAVNFAIEELFTNMVKYNRGEHDVRIALEFAGDRLVARMTDFDVEPFDPTAAPDAEVDRPLEQRKVGGLGLHLTRRLVDDIEYDYTDRRSTITVTKRTG